MLGIRKSFALLFVILHAVDANATVTLQRDTTLVLDATVLPLNEASQIASVLDLPTSELFDLLEPNYFITSPNFTGKDGRAPLFQTDNQVRFRVAVRFRFLGATTGMTNFVFPGAGREEVYDTGIHFGYVQNSFWNLWSVSSPFRDNNYSPQGFLYVDGRDFFVTEEGHATNQWCHPSARFGWLHESNGISGPGSRSWDRVNLTFEFGHSRLHDFYMSASIWAVAAKAPENKDILETNGLGELRFFWQPGLSNSKGGLESRGLSLFTRLGGGGERFFKNAEITGYWNPFYGEGGSWSPTTMLQVFLGSGQFLQDHRKDTWAVRLGFAFIR